MLLALLDALLALLLVFNVLASLQCIVGGGILNTEPVGQAERSTNQASQSESPRADFMDGFRKGIKTLFVHKALQDHAFTWLLLVGSLRCFVVYKS